MKMRRHKYQYASLGGLKLISFTLNNTFTKS